MTREEAIDYAKNANFVPAVKSLNFQKMQRISVTVVNIGSFSKR